MRYSLYYWSRIVRAKSAMYLCTLEERLISSRFFIKGEIEILGFYFLTFSLVVFICDKILTLKARTLLDEWTPAFNWHVAFYNYCAFNYSFLVIGISGLLVVHWLLACIPRIPARLLIWMTKLSPLFAYIAFAFFLIVEKPILAQASLLAALAIFLRTAFRSPWREALLTRRSTMTAVEIIAAVLLLVQFSMFLRAWYPVHLPNDFYELSDRAYLPNAGPITQTKRATASRQAIVVCLNAAAQRDAAHQSLQCSEHLANVDLAPLADAMTATANWQAQTGRTLYHHSYILVPAVHFLKYGIAAPIPALYGVGNTLLFALFLKITSPTLTAYFNIFPVSQVLGICVILSAVFYITQSVFGTLIAAALLLLAVVNIPYEATLLAPGFSPVRYIGLTAQIASVFWLLRRPASKLRQVGFVGVLAFSIFWNTEFAVIGVIGQAIAVLAPGARFVLGRRLLLLLSLAVVTVIVMGLISYVGRGYLTTIQLGIFGAGVPQITPTALNLFAVATLPIFIGGVCTLCYFDAEEQSARLAILPVLALVENKFLYNPAPVHLVYAYIIIAPLVTTFVRWNTPSWATLKVFGVITLALFVLPATLTYVRRGHQYRQLMVDPFVLEQWSAQGETLPTPTPAAPIAERVAAVKKMMSPNDYLLVLSPFDYLLGFYANPIEFCGHFELLTNIVLNQNKNEVYECVRDKRHSTLVVFDEALNLPCPTPALSDFSKGACASKVMTKESVASLMSGLKSDLTLVGKVGPLSFYRRKDDVPTARGAPL